MLLLLKEQEIGRFEQNSQQVWKSISPRFRFKQVHVDGVEEETFDHCVLCYQGGVGGWGGLLKIVETQLFVIGGWGSLWCIQGRPFSQCKMS